MTKGNLALLNPCKRLSIYMYNFPFPISALSSRHPCTPPSVLRSASATTPRLPPNHICGSLYWHITGDNNRVAVDIYNDSGEIGYPKPSNTAAFKSRSANQPRPEPKGIYPPTAASVFVV